MPSIALLTLRLTGVTNFRPRPSKAVFEIVAAALLFGSSCGAGGGLSRWRNDWTRSWDGAHSRHRRNDRDFSTVEENLGPELSAFTRVRKGLE